MDTLKIFIGYDPKEAIAYHVLASSIIRRSSKPVSITPIALDHLGDIYKRDRGPTESTEFSISRFLVPYLSNWEGISIFMDCDMLCLSDINLVIEREVKEQPDKTVWVCKHPMYTPSTKTKFLGQQQTMYPCKNWSSFMIFNNAKCKNLTPEYVNKASGLDLHRFNWVQGGEHSPEIGSISLKWNWLVGEYRKGMPVHNLHYTLGGPWFKEYENCDYAQEWRDELKWLSR